MSDLPDTWAHTKLSEVAEVHDDLREPVNANERSKRVGPYPYYGATGQVGWIDAFRQDGEYVLLGEDGAPFFDLAKPKAYLVTGKSWVNNHAHVLKGKDGICQNRFLLHALNHANYRGYANGTTRLKLTQGAMLELPIRLAPIGEQCRVVEKLEELLSDLDAGIAALEKAQANLKRYRAAVLKAAVEGQLTEKWRAAHPDAEPARKLLERILAERRKKWEEAQLKKFAEKGQAPPKGWKDRYVEPAKPDDAALPELPKGWCWATVDQVSLSIRYGTSAKTREELHGVPVLRMGNIQDGRFDLSRLKFLPEKHEEFPELFLEAGDLLFNRTNSFELVGKSAVFKGIPSPCSYASYLIGIRPVSGWESDVLAFFINSSLGRAWIASVVSQQVGQANVNGSKLAALAFPLPPAKEQAEVVKSVEEQISSLDQTSKESESLLLKSARLRQSILKRAFEGRLVPQDPKDEPASELLARIRKGAVRGKGLIGQAKGALRVRQKIRTT